MEDEAIIVDGDGGGGVEAAGRGEEGGICGSHFFNLFDGYAGCKVERRSTLGPCKLLGRSLVSWSSKKQNSVALSTAEAEYIAAGSCCAQILWMKATLKDFGINFKEVPLLCDNESAVKLTNNPVQHSRTKHIDVRHHFIRDHQRKGDICIHRRSLSLGPVHTGRVRCDTGRVRYFKSESPVPCQCHRQRLLF